MRFRRKGRFSSALAADALSPRIIQLAVEEMRGMLGLPDSATPARAAPLLRDAPSGARRRPRGIQELLGHASLSTTQLYTKIDATRLMDAFDAAHPRSRTKA